MSTLAVTVERLRIAAHPDADALELAEVGLYRAVVAKGAFRTGDLALYVPEQAVLPAGLIEELGLTGRLGGSRHDRVTAVRLRGQLSQGLVCRPAALGGVDWEEAHAERTDFARTLGISKWVPPVPPELAGRVFDAPDLLPWVDIENLRRHPEAFTPGERVQATEKVHGSACCLTLVDATDEVLVSSKGFAARRQALAEDGGGVYWRAARAHHLPAAARGLADRLGATRVGLFGEVFGPGSRTCGTAGSPWATAASTSPSSSVAGCPGCRRTSCGTSSVRCRHRSPASPSSTTALSTPRSCCPWPTGARWWVRRPTCARASCCARCPSATAGVLGSRAVAKIVSGAYLTRRGGTEYE